VVAAFILLARPVAGERAVELRGKLAADPGKE